MTTPHRIEANRRNAQKSRGPKTPEGKARSRFNAVKHGMYARTPVLPGEDAGAFQSRIDTWKADLRPRNELEDSLIERAALASWQLERAERVEVDRLTDRIPYAQADDDGTVANADLLAFDDSEDGERLHRLQAACARSLFRSLDALLKARRDAQADDGSQDQNA
jgi:hypothetical protein